MCSDSAVLGILLRGSYYASPRPAHKCPARRPHLCGHGARRPLRGIGEHASSVRLHESSYGWRQPGHYSKPITALHHQLWGKTQEVKGVQQVGMLAATKRPTRRAWSASPNKCGVYGGYAIAQGGHGLRDRLVHRANYLPQHGSKSCKRSTLWVPPPHLRQSLGNGSTRKCAVSPITRQQIQ